MKHIGGEGIGVSAKPWFNLDFHEWIRYNDLVDNIIRISALDQMNVKNWLMELRQIDRNNRHLSGGLGLTVYINSPGGGAYHALALYDALRRMSSRWGYKIKCIVEGWAASAAAMIVLQAGDERIAGPNARFLLHEARRWVFLAQE